MDAVSATAAPVYQRHEPEESLLYQVLAEHLETFLQEVARDDHGLPAGCPAAQTGCIRPPIHPGQLRCAPSPYLANTSHARLVGRAPRWPLC